MKEVIEFLGNGLGAYKRERKLDVAITVTVHEGRAVMFTTKQNHTWYRHAYLIKNYVDLQELLEYMERDLQFFMLDQSTELNIIANAPCHDWESYCNGEYYKEGEYGVHHWENGAWSINSDGNLGSSGRSRGDIIAISELSKNK